MACGTTVGDTLDTGVPADEAGLVTSSVTVTNKADKAEARDRCGRVISVTYYNYTSEIEIEGLGTPTVLVGAALSLAGSYLTLAGAAFVDEVSVTHKSGEYVTGRVRATAYEGIAGAS